MNKHVIWIIVVVFLLGCQGKSPETTSSVVPSSKNNITAVNPRTYTAAYKQFYSKAVAGDAIAQNNLGHMYADGRGVPQDQVAAVKWFKLAAQQDNVDAQINLAMAYWYGRGVAHNAKQTCRLLKQAVEQGSDEARQMQQQYC